MAQFAARPTPLVLITISGMGHAPSGPGNAVTLAKTPNLDYYWDNYPHSLLEIVKINHGEGEPLNDEKYNQLVIGTGHQLRPGPVRLKQAYANGYFQDNQELNIAIKATKETKNKIHIISLVSQDNYYADRQYLWEILRMIESHKFNPDEVYLHVILDNEKTTVEAFQLIQEVEQHLVDYGVGRIASVTGKYYALDRDQRWNRTKMFYDLLCHGIGKISTNTARTIQDFQRHNNLDELPPTPIVIPGEDAITIGNDDLVICTHQRGEGITQICQALTEHAFSGFHIGKRPQIKLIGLVEYQNMQPPIVAFPADPSDTTLSLVLSKNNLTQVKLGETIHFKETNYYLNGATINQYPGEDWIEIPSLELKDYNLYDRHPEMRTKELIDHAIGLVSYSTYNFVMLHLTALDVMGHTGVLDAAVAALEIIDRGIGKLVKQTIDKRGAVIITSDHGNAENMVDRETGNSNIENTRNPIPLMLIAPEFPHYKVRNGALIDIAPTVLELLNLPQPITMSGRSLLNIR